MSRTHHAESARIVNQAIDSLGLGKKGLAERLNKDPSLISRYASGVVRPKAETLLECMKFVDNDLLRASAELPLERETEYLKLITGAIGKLSPETDSDLIQTIFKVLKLARKI